MTNLKDFFPTPHWSKQVFKDHGFPIAAVAKYLGLAYSYTSNILSGIRQATPQVEAKLRELVDQVEKESEKAAA
jgi:hypothetical protein